MTTDVTKSPADAIWTNRYKMTQSDLTDFAQQITFRHPNVPGPIHNHHTDVELAHAAGFEKPVAEPMQYLAYVDNELLSRYEQQWLEHGELRATILGPVYAGDEIEIRLGPAQSVADSPTGEVQHQYAVFAREVDLVTVGTVSVHTAE